MTHTQPNIAFAVGLVYAFSQYPHENHQQAAKLILRYIQGTASFGIHYTIGTFELVGFIDSDWAGLVDDRKSTSNFSYHIGSTLIAWSCKKQSTIALSSAKAIIVL